MPATRRFHTSHRKFDIDGRQRNNKTYLSKSHWTFCFVTPRELGSPNTARRDQRRSLRIATGTSAVFLLILYAQAQERVSVPCSELRPKREHMFSYLSSRRHLQTLHMYVCRTFKMGNLKRTVVVGRAACLANVASTRRDHSSSAYPQLSPPEQYCGPPLLPMDFSHNAITVPAPHFPPQKSPPCLSLQQLSRLL